MTFMENMKLWKIIKIVKLKNEMVKPKQEKQNDNMINKKALAKSDVTIKTSLNVK